MLQIGMTVKVLPDAEYGGKYTGCVGVVKNYYSSKKKAGVELEKVQNDASSKGLFWFSEDKLAPANDFLGSSFKNNECYELSVQFPPSPYRRSPCEEGDLPVAPKLLCCGQMAPKPLFPVALVIHTTTTPGSVPLW